MSVTNAGIGIEPSADAVEKYSSNRGFSLETFGDLELPQMVVGPLAEAGNFFSGGDNVGIVCHSRAPH